MVRHGNHGGNLPVQPRTVEVNTTPVQVEHNNDFFNAQHHQVQSTPQQVHDDDYNPYMTTYEQKEAPTTFQTQQHVVNANPTTTYVNANPTTYTY